MKHLKQKLYATLAMLMVATTMLATSTYAWFAISTAPEVGQITTKMEASGALEIALGTTSSTEGGKVAPTETALGDATTGDTTWGATVTGVTHTTGLQFPVTIGTDDSEDTYQLLAVPTYDETGRPGALDVATVTTSDYADGMATVTATITLDDGDEDTKTDATEQFVVASSTLLWLRSNVAASDVKATFDGAVTLTDSSGAAIDTGATDYTGITATDIGVAVLLDGKYVELNSTGVTIGSLTANTATAVEVIVYLDGDTIQNADIASEINIAIGTITFSSETVDAVGTSA